MKPLEFLTLAATCLGLIATVLNLVAFIREKDRSHVKVGASVLLGLVLLGGLILLPRLAPQTTSSLARRLPVQAARVLRPWLDQGGAAPEVAREAAPSPAMQGSATIDIRRNFLGGIDALVATFRFVDLSGRGGRVTAWGIDEQEAEGGQAYGFERVLESPVAVPPGGTATTEVELDREIGDRWLARRDAEAPGRLAIRWDAQGADGAPIRFDWADRVSR